MLHAFAERKLPQCHSLGTLSSRTDDDRDSERISSAKIIILTTYETAVQGGKLEAGAYLLKTHLGRRFPRQSSRGFPEREEPHGFVTNPSPDLCGQKEPVTIGLQSCDGERFASFTMCATINLAMSALIFTGDLQEVLPGTLAVRGEPGKQCAVCESCKRLICKVLR
jgi:hypothetical protein